jgi:hypothetical protein
MQGSLVANRDKRGGTNSFYPSGNHTRNLSQDDRMMEVEGFESQNTEGQGKTEAVDPAA